ncbi:hypothetical protein GCM10009665_55920 [Kitasatospora nipponensis]|uniref:Uncharacterized protein n=1 Tax=Kitasatospora nipponensis TaxID=258049 RepID=A0ABP4HGP8_9ACTN
MADSNLNKWAAWATIIGAAIAIPPFLVWLFKVLGGPAPATNPTPRPITSPASAHEGGHPLGYAFLVALLIVIGFALTAFLLKSFSSSSSSGGWTDVVFLLFPAIPLVGTVAAPYVYWVKHSTTGWGLFGIVLLWGAATLLGCGAAALAWSAAD